jgi:hypothetical protein
MAMRREMLINISIPDPLRHKAYMTGNPGAVGIDKEDDESK